MAHDGLKDAHQWLLQMMLQVMLEVNGKVVLKGKDGVLCLLPGLGPFG